MKGLQLTVSGLAVLMAGAALAEEPATGLPDTGTARERLFKRASDLSLDRFTRTSDALQLIADEDWRRALDAAGLSVADEGGNAYRFSLDAADLELPQEEHDAFVSAGLPTRLDDVVLDMVLSLDGDLTPEALENGAVTLIELTRIGLDIGETSLSGKGRAEANADGRMQGEIGLTVEKWRAILALPAFAGLNTGGQLESALETFATGDTLIVTLKIIDGRVKLGPLELARLPPAWEGI